MSPTSTVVRERLMLTSDFQRLEMHVRRMHAFQIVDAAVFITAITGCMAVAVCIMGDIAVSATYALYNIRFYCTLILCVAVGISWHLRRFAFRSHFDVRRVFVTRLIQRLTEWCDPCHTRERTMLLHQALLMCSASPHRMLAKEQLLRCVLCAIGMWIIPHILSPVYWNMFSAAVHSDLYKLLYIGVPLLTFVPLWYGTIAVGSVHHQAWEMTSDGVLRYCTPPSLVEHTQIAALRTSLRVQFYNDDSFQIENPLEQETQPPRKRASYLRVVK